MDPNANLREQLELAGAICSAFDPDDAVTRNPEAASRLAELVLALDEWITRGGFLPAGWISK